MREVKVAALHIDYKNKYIEFTVENEVFDRLDKLKVILGDNVYLCSLEEIRASYTANKKITSTCVAKWLNH